MQALQSLVKRMDKFKISSLKKKMGIAARTFTAIAVIGAFIYYLVEKRNAFIAVLDVSWLHVLIIGIAVVLTWLINSIQTFVLLRAEGIRIGFIENFMLIIATIMANYMPMKVGTVLRLRYLKTIHGLRYARSGSLMGIRMVILICTTGVLGCTGTIGLLVTGYPFSSELTAFFSVMIFVSILAYCIPPPKFKNRKNFFVRTWTDFSIGFEVMRARPSVTLLVMALVVAQFAVLSFRFYLTFSMVQFHPSPWILLLLAPLVSLLGLLSITPGGGMGLREGVIGYVTMVSGYDFNSGFFAGTVDRAVLLILTFTLGTVAVVYIWMRTKSAETKNISIL